MTTEEIEKAAEDYSKEYWREVSGMTNVEESIIYSMDNFKAGVEFSDKHWQEKTRWIPIEERLPEVRKTPFFIAVTAHDGSDKFRANIKTFLIRDESDIRWMVMNCKYWKEIE